MAATKDVITKDASTKNYPRLSWCDNEWDDDPISSDILLDDKVQHSGTHIFFLPPIKKLNKDDDLCKRLSQKFYIDPFFWKDKTYESNGFFMSKYNPIYAQKPGIKSYCSISRFLIKEVQNTERKVAYIWQYLSFASLWISGDEASNTQILLCFDLTDEMRENISRSFINSDAENLNCDPFEVYAILADAITDRYDEALWGFRTPVRDIEKNRVNLNMTTSIPDRRFNGLVKKSETMYELSRHITHARETLKVAADTLETIENYRGAFYASIPSGISAEVFRFFSSYLTNLERRAESFEHRLQNEMQLVYHLISAEEASKSRSALDGMVKTLKEMKDITSESLEISENMKAETTESIHILNSIKTEFIDIMKIIKDDLSTAKQTINVIQQQRATTSRSTESMKSWKDIGTLILLLLLTNTLTHTFLAAI